MTESELLIVLNRFFSEGATLSIYTYLGAGVVTFIAGTVGVYISAYIKKDAEIKAINGKLDATNEQLAKQTLIVKKVEAEISNQSWVEQQRWLFRKDLYLAIIELLIKARDQSKELDSILNCVNPFCFDEESNLDEDAQLEIWENHKDEVLSASHKFVTEHIKPIAEEVALLVNQKGRLFLNAEAISILGKFYNSHKTWYEEELEEEGFEPDKISSVYALPSGPCEAGYLAHYSKAAKNAYIRIITEARDDLKIDMSLTD